MSVRRQTLTVSWIYLGSEFAGHSTCNATTKGDTRVKIKKKGILIVLTVILSVRARPNLVDNQTYL